MNKKRQILISSIKNSSIGIMTELLFIACLLVVALIISYISTGLVK